jgi:sugar lactone lactonase YvrE
MTRHFRISTALNVGAASVVALTTLAAAAQQPEMVWEATGFEAPESALYDAANDLVYVSNIAGQPLEKDGNGYISKLGADGQLVEQQWATGLDAPTGMALHEGTLYVADIDSLVAVSVEDGKIADRWTLSGAKFLNDVAVDGQGRVFVSDMLDAAIYVLDGGEFSEWIKGGNITAPNGLLTEENRLVVASWGVLSGEGFETETPGHLKVVDLATGEVQSLGTGAPIGHLDGVEPDGQGRYLVTDWMDGALLRVSAEGEAEQLLDLDQGSADLGYIQDQNLVLIPMMSDGKVVAYRIE